MRLLRYSINVTLDGCCDHTEGVASEGIHRNARLNIERADALLFGRITYEMMEAGWRHASTENRPAWMLPFAQTINAAKKHVVSSTPVDAAWNAERVQGDLRTAVEALKAQPGDSLFTGGVTLPMALARLGLIDEYELVVHPRVAGHGPYLLAGLSPFLELDLVDSEPLGGGVVAMRYVPSKR